MSKSNLKPPSAPAITATKLAPEVAISLMTAFSGDMHNPTPEVAFNLVRLAKEKLESSPAIQSALGLDVDVDKLSDEKAIELAVQVFESVMHASEPIMAGRARGFQIEPAPPSTDLVSELNSLNFETIIGGPLQAVVKAQMQASIATMDFIDEVGFVYEKVDGVDVKKLAMVNFSYSKMVPKLDPEGKPEVDIDNNPVYIPQKVDINVPMLSIVNVPSLRIQDVDITFNAKLNSMQTQTVSTDAKASFSAELKAKKVTMNLSVSAQRSSTSGTKVEKEYSLGVHVKMTQDEIPKGLEKVLNLLAAV